MTVNEKTWKGDEARALRLYRPCECGCDMRGRTSGVGYLSGSDAKGNGFTIWIETEAVYKRLQKLLKTV